MILLFDDGGDKIVGFYEKGQTVGKFGVNKIWATNIDNIYGTKHDEFNSIDEALEHIASKGTGYSPIFTEEGIEVIRDSNEDTNTVVITNYIYKNNKPVQIGDSKSEKRDVFLKRWNKYKNTGIKTTPTQNFIQ